MKAYIIFQNSDLKVLKCLKNNFRHCDILLDNNIGIEITRNGIDIVNTDKNVLFDKIKNTGIIIVEYEIIKSNYSIIGLKTCVGICKDILGIKDFFIFTPYQLYKKLLKNGGKIWEKQ
jgi:hypothetical protein